MSSARPVCLLLALLTGCANLDQGDTPPPLENQDFALPAGAPRNVRVGFVEAAPPGSQAFAIVLTPGTIVREGYELVSRDAQLRPTAVLRISHLHGRVALARLARGRPQPKDEAVLPTSELRKLAEALPAAPPGS